MSIISTSDKNKLGNTVVYIATRVQRLSKTKLIKLLYLMEDYSVKRFHQPFLGLPFEAWQAGPVIKDVFIDLSETPIILKDFINKQNGEGSIYISAKKEFDDNEFSDNDLLVMEEILKKYGSKTATELVRLTHRQDGLWYRTCSEHNLLEDFKKGLRNNSNCVLDLGSELSGCAQEFYNEQLEFLNMARRYDCGQ